MEQLELLYEGKAKTVFATANPEEVVMHFKDDATAFNNIKKAKIANKGILSNAISTILFVTVLLLLILVNVREAHQAKVQARRDKMGG